MDVNNSLEKYNHSLTRVGKQIAVTNKLLKKINPLPIISKTVTDIEGNIYHTVKIGTQVWMVENLNVNHFKNGEIIPEAKTDKEWEEAGKNKQAAWCYYDNNPENGKIYGKLYNWYAVNDSRGLAPKGGHIPTDDEWTMLTNFLGEESVAFGKLKEAGTLHWERQNRDDDNSSGFTALPGGGRGSDGLFCAIGGSSLWWSSTEDNTDYAWNQGMGYGGSEVIRLSYLKTVGHSVHCISDK